ncbi:lysoplasmalogenase family protein [Anaerotignum sp.]
MMDGLRFLWIIFCFLLSFWNGLPIAALFTLWGDFFLLFTDIYTIGVSFFLFVQLAYLCNLQGRVFPWRALVFLPMGIVLSLLFLGILYTVLFFCHFFLALQKEKAQPSVSRKLYLLGLVLFICCDIAVAWGYFFTPIPWLIWLFYAPSQLLLALTAKTYAQKVMT